MDMVTDIHGWIERKELTNWRAVANVGELLPRSYPIFGMLFNDINWDEEVTSIQVETETNVWKFYKHITSVDTIEWETQQFSQPFEADGQQCRIARVNRRYFFSPSEWNMVVRWMNDLISIEYIDDVRFVVWFDS
jgi:hypothetical protein